MSFSSKLARLVGPAPAESPTPTHNAVLADLRARMERILEKSLRPGRAQSLDREELPFVTLETPRGPLHVRRLELGSSHRIGHAPVFSARHGDARLLSLLALDPSLSACEPSRALYLDTETTGLSQGTGTVAFLVGLAFFHGETLVVEQLLVRNLGEEAPMLERVLERMSEASMVVTFNGKAFDLPLLRTRLVMARLAPFVDVPHLDLLHVARRLHKPRGIDCRLTGLERDVLGFVRHDDTPSGEVSACYLHFLRTGNTRPLLGVIEHNAWDVVTMVALVGLYGEPLVSSRLTADDLAGVSLTMKRARAMNEARAASDLALDRGGGQVSLRAGAQIAKAMGDRQRALSLFEQLAGEVDCKKTRLELAMLYEHHSKDLGRALSMLDAPLAEAEQATEKRRARLLRKSARKRQEKLF